MKFSQDQLITQGNQIVPSSQFSLRRPADYLNILYFATKYQNYVKLVFLKLLRLEVDAQHERERLFRERMTLMFLRKAALKLAKNRAYIQNIDEYNNARQK